MSKVIITAAITGGIHTPTMTPYLPITPKEIADDRISRPSMSGASGERASPIFLHQWQDYLWSIGEDKRSEIS